MDAILGSEKQMHTVIQASCIGCDLCIPACPVDCIEPTPLPSAYRPIDKENIAARTLARKKRLEAKANIMTPLNLSLDQKREYIQSLLLQKKKPK